MSKAEPATCEEWRRIPIDTVGAYEVSNLGRVRSARRIIKANPAHGRYLKFTFSNGKKKGTLRVARCVAAAFLPPPPTKAHQVNHKNGNKTDNSVSNLEWVTRSENRRHAYATGLQRRVVGESNKAAKLNGGKVLLIRARLASGHSRSTIAAEFGVGVSCVYEIDRRITWAHL